MNNTNFEPSIEIFNEDNYLATPAFAGTPHQDTYDYTKIGRDEEIIQEFGEGNPLTSIVRSNLGFLVLSTKRVMFVDIDLSPKIDSKEFSRGVRDIMRGLNGLESVQEFRRAEVLKRIKKVSQSRLTLGCRVYRTAAGLRLLMTDRVYDPSDQNTEALLTAFGSDPLYIRFCKRQACFRARITPKCRRCGVEAPPFRTPWADAERQQEYRAWEDNYHQQAKKFAVCEFVCRVGARDIDESVQTIIDIHDLLTLRDGAMLA